MSFFSLDTRETQWKGSLETAQLFFMSIYLTLCKRFEKAKTSSHALSSKGFCTFYYSPGILRNKDKLKLCLITIVFVSLSSPSASFLFLLPQIRRSYLFPDARCPRDTGHTEHSMDGHTAVLKGVFPSETLPPPSQTLTSSVLSPYNPANPCACPSNWHGFTYDNWT